MGIFSLFMWWLDANSPSVVIFTLYRVVEEQKDPVRYLEHSGPSNGTDALHDYVEEGLQYADVPRHKQTARHGRVDVAPTHMSHSLKQWYTLYLHMGENWAVSSVGFHKMTDRPTNQPTPWSRFLLGQLVVTQMVRNFRPFTELKGSLPSSQEPATGPYCKPDVFSPHLPNLFPWNPF